METENLERKCNPKNWLQYYSRKRITHQWMQINLLAETDAKKILEVGPAMGAVTALLDNAGYRVTTLDFTEQQFHSPKVPHIKRNLLDVDASEIGGHDAIICCETLEHIPYTSVDRVIEKFHESGARHLLVSVPYMAFQVTFDLYFNAHTFTEYFSMKKLRFLKDFVPEPEFGHQWEVGYRGYKLASWEAKLERCGYQIVSREFTEHCRSVFHLLERR